MAGRVTGYRDNERVLYLAFVLTGSLTFAIVPLRSETPATAERVRSTLQHYISPPSRAPVWGHRLHRGEHRIPSRGDPDQRVSFHNRSSDKMLLLKELDKILHEHIFVHDVAKIFTFVDGP